MLDIISTLSQDKENIGAMLDLLSKYIYGSHKAVPQLGGLAFFKVDSLSRNGAESYVLISRQVKMGIEPQAIE